MKHKLLIVLIGIYMMSLSCFPDHIFFSTFAIEAFAPLECQNDFLRPQSASISFRTTYIVEDEAGEPVPSAAIFREFTVVECDGSSSDLSKGLVFTESNGQFTETDHFTSHYTNDKISIKASLFDLKPSGVRSFRQRAKDGSTTFKFIVQELED